MRYGDTFTDFPLDLGRFGDTWTDHFAGTAGAQHAARLRVDEALRPAVRAPDGQGATGCRPWEGRLLVVDAVGLGARLRETHPGDLGVRVGDGRDRARVERDVVAGDHLGG